MFLAYFLRVNHHISFIGDDKMSDVDIGYIENKQFMYKLIFKWCIVSINIEVPTKCAARKVR